jgi:quinolinate synthase
MHFNKIQRDILELKKEKNALLLAHNYQIPEIQVLADYIGDSLGLCRAAQKAENVDLIIFCGVDFMAESASVLNPDKKVILPTLKARCPMAAMLPINKLLEAKKVYPDAPIVLYVNTLAETKAEATVTCTSANADIIVRKLNTDTVIFGPDENLAYYIQKRVPNVNIITIPEFGHCNVHRFLGKGDEAMILKSKYPKAELIIHPECEPEFQERADYVLSTGGMVKRVKESETKTFIIGTEIGLIHRLRREFPGKTFLPVKAYAECASMKRITLKNTFEALVNEDPEVRVPEHIATRVRIALERMLELSE